MILSFSILLIFISTSLQHDLQDSPCQKTISLPTLKYFISSNFIWFPASVTNIDLLKLLQSSHPELQSTATPRVGSKIQSAIVNFLRSPCTLHLTVTVASYASAQQSLRLVNETLGTTDLMCRLATHKTGRIYKDNAHVMLPAKLRATITPANTTCAVNTSSISKQCLSEAAGFAYTVKCPQYIIPAENTAAAAEIIEDPLAMAIVKDCGWCQRVDEEMKSICRNNGSLPVDELASFFKMSRWIYGDTTCLEC